MRSVRVTLACLLISALAAGVAIAQEGFPLQGSWLGDWGPSSTARNPAFIVLDWDGRRITGTLNPGTDNIPLQNATLTSPWMVHFEAEARDRSGAPVRYVIDGKIENVGLANRAIVGTWTVGTTTNTFKLVRQ
jgi:hypothetical protein